jgi:hypothetical protein
MNTRDNIKLILKLNRETKEDKIKWEISSNRINSLVGTETLINNIYIVDILNNKFRLYKFKEKHFYDEDAYNWIEDYKLDLIDNFGNSKFTFESDRAIVDLYGTVQYKTSNIEDFMKDYLKDEPEE